jgi:hypothetical protein
MNSKSISHSQDGEESKLLAIRLLISSKCKSKQIIDNLLDLHFPADEENQQST